MSTQCQKCGTWWSGDPSLDCCCCKKKEEVFVVVRHPGSEIMYYLNCAILVESGVEKVSLTWSKERPGSPPACREVRTMLLSVDCARILAEELLARVDALTNDALEAMHKRDQKIRYMQPHCPACGTGQVQIMDRKIPAGWRCRQCKWKFDFERS